MKELSFITIFTPAYNRAHTLERLYLSLKMQNDKRFEWLIIDDGSTDNTESIVEGFCKDVNLEFNIRYYKQKNSGKQAAWNNALSMAKGELFCCLDSDDALYSENNIKNIYCKYSDFLDDDKVLGFRFLAFSNIKNTFDGQMLSNEIVVDTYFYELSNHKNYGERIDFIKTSIAKNYLFPVENDIKFIPEIWFYVAVAKDKFSFVYVPEPARIFFDDDVNNRLSRSSIKKHAKGHYISRSKIIREVPWRVFLTNPWVFFVSLVRYSQCANYLRVKVSQRNRDVGFLYTLLSLILFPLVFFLK